MIDRQTILNRLPSAGRWYAVENAEAGRATIRIFDEIGYWGVSEEAFARDLAQITADEIEVQISSPGGEAFAGIAIYNQLRAHPARILTRVDGLAASAASVIVQAGDERLIMSSAQMMIHDAWGICMGPAADMRETADMLDKLSGTLAGIYAGRSGGEVDTFRDLMRTDTYLTDVEAVALGLADEVYEPPRAGDDPSAAVGARPRALVFNSKPKTANETPTGPQGQKAAPMPTLTDLRATLGLADDVDDDAVHAAALTRITDTTALLAQVPPPPPDQASLAAAEAENTAMRATVDRLVSEETARTEREFAATREQVLATAVREGRISPHERTSLWEPFYDANPDVATVQLAKLPANRIPVAEIGHSAGVDDADPIAAAMNGLGGTLDYADLLGRQEH